MAADDVGLGVEGGVEVGAGGFFCVSTASSCEHPASTRTTPTRIAVATPRTAVIVGCAAVPPASRPRFTAVLFDLDGTIWDSLPGIVRCLAYALDVVGLAVPSEAVLASNVGPPLDVMLAAQGVPADRIVAARTAYRDRYQRLGEFECEVYPGAPELLDDLRSHGVRLATATSKGVEPTHRMLEHFDLARRFDVIAAATTRSTSCGPRWATCRRTTQLAPRWSEIAASTSMPAVTWASPPSA